MTCRNEPTSRQPVATRTGRHQGSANASRRPTSRRSYPFVETRSSTTHQCSVRGPWNHAQGGSGARWYNEREGMSPSHKFSRFAALLALLICVVAVAVFSSSVPAAGAMGPSISGLLPASAPGPSQLVRFNHAQHARVLSRVPVCTLVRPVLAPRPSADGEPVRGLFATCRPVFGGTRAGRSPPCFS